MLYGPAHRIFPLGKEMIEGGHQTSAPRLPEVSLRFSYQGSHPVTLAGPREIGGPPPHLQSVGQTRTDRLNSCLESPLVPLRLQPHHTTANMTPVTPQPQPLAQPVKISEYKTMAPYLAYETARADPRPTPWIILPQCKDLLDLGSNKEYQDLIVWGPKSPSVTGRCSSAKRSPPNLFSPIKKASTTRPIYSDNLHTLVNLL